MSAQVKMPQLGGADNARIARWLKQVGQRVERYEPLAEIVIDSGDLVTISRMPSPFGGTLVEILMAEGTTVSVGTAIAKIETLGSTSSRPGEIVWMGQGVRITRAAAVPVDTEPVRDPVFGITTWESGTKKYVEIPMFVSADVQVNEGESVSLEEGLYEIEDLVGQGKTRWRDTFVGNFQYPGDTDPRVFEDMVASLLVASGFEAIRSGQTGDGGVDVLARRTDPLLSGLYVVQCKCWTQPVGVEVVRDLYGTVIARGANKGILVTSSTFSRQAIEFAQGKPIELIDGRMVVDLVRQLVKTGAIPR